MLADMASAQILTESSPLLPMRAVTKRSAAFVLPSPDIARLEREDELNDKFKNRPWRFGENYKVDINPAADGDWTAVDNMMVWEMEFKADKAITLNYFFDQFFLPPSAELFIINEATGEYFGAITGKNNSDLNNMSTWPFEGTHHIIRLKVLKKEQSLVQLHLAQVTHGYRNYKSGQGIGESGSCNINALCPEAAAWTNQKNADVMIVAGGSGLCSGTLINNTMNNGRPYVLTAEHCGFSANWNFRFNYQSSQCGSNVYTQANQNVSGAIMRAHNSESDFALLEMKIKPPASYNAYYAAWDRSDTANSSQICFHHPSGDLKKFSKNNDAGIKTVFDNVVAWQVDEWDLGTTEGGSSGSALYDQNGRVIGQLNGGFASCDDLDKSDYYGRLAYSFHEHNNDSAKTLLYWLDPGCSGTKVLDGLDPAAPKPNLDLAIFKIEGINASNCTGTLVPAIHFLNNGLQTLTNATFTVTFDGVNPQQYTWNGTLAYGDSAVISLPSKTFTNGAHTINIAGTANNGNDENPVNNTSTKEFTTTDIPLIHTMVIVLDEFGSENSWKIYDSSNTEVASDGPYPDNKPDLKITTQVCLVPGCYRLEVADAYGDGMCCAFGDGSYTFIESRGDTLAKGWRTPDGPEGIEVIEKTSFCIDPVGITEIGGLSFSAWPNPVADQLSLSFTDDKTYKAELMELSGRSIAVTEVSNAKSSLKLNEFANGLYLLRVSSKDGNFGVIKIQILK